MLGSGCGLVGTDVVSHFRAPRIESSHWENFIMNMFSVGKTKIKKKMPETANLKINSRFIVLYLICEVIWAKISGQKGDVLSECKPMGLSYRNQQLYRASFINLTSPPNGFYRGHQCLWTLTLPTASRSPTYNLKRKYTGLRQGLNLLCPRSLSWMGEPSGAKTMLGILLYQFWQLLHW